MIRISASDSSQNCHCAEIRFCFFWQCQGNDHFGGAIALSLCESALSTISDNTFSLCKCRPPYSLGFVTGPWYGGAIAVDLKDSGSITISRCCGTNCWSTRCCFIFLRYLTGPSLTDLSVLECGKPEFPDSKLGAVYWTAEASARLSVTNITSCWTNEDGAAVYREPADSRGSNPSFFRYLTVSKIDGKTGMWTAGFDHTVDLCNFISNPVQNLFWLDGGRNMTITRCCFQGNTGTWIFNGRDDAKFDVFSCYFDGGLGFAAHVASQVGSFESTKRSLAICQLSTFLCAADPGCSTARFAPSSPFPPSGLLRQTDNVDASPNLDPSVQLDFSFGASYSQGFRSSAAFPPSPAFAVSLLPAESAQPNATLEIGESAPKLQLTRPFANSVPHISPPLVETAALSASVQLRETSPLDDRHDRGPVPQAGFDLMWLVLAAVVFLIVCGVAAVVAAVVARRVCKEAPVPVEDVSNDMEDEPWIMNPQTIAEEQVFASIFVDTHDESLFVRI
jgi:hypothetical protein